MSVRSMARVWEGSKHSGTELLMLLAIADFADDAGRAYPSISTLAAKCRTKPRYAMVLLEALTASGELEVRKNAGPIGRGGRTNLYRIMFDQLTHQVPELVNHGAPVDVAEPVNQSAPPQQAEAVHPGAPVNQSAPVHQGSGSSAPGFREVVHQGAPKPSGTIRTIEEVRKAPRDAADRGSRLPADWALPDTWRSWCVEHRPDLNPDQVADTFADYWRGIAGAKGRKADWFATWRNWCRGQRNVTAQTASQPKPAQVVALAADEQFTLEGEE
jgi:hypothetical protein